MVKSNRVNYLPIQFIVFFAIYPLTQGHRTQLEIGNIEKLTNLELFIIQKILTFDLFQYESLLHQFTVSKLCR